jgi:hypothetical protein
MKDTVFQIVDTLTEALDGSASIDDLRVIRQKMDSWTFRENVKAALRGANDPGLRDGLRKLQRGAEDLSTRRSNVRELFRIGGVGGGISLIGGGIVAAITAATPAALIIPIIGTTVIAWRSVVHSNRFSEEIGLLSQIGEIAKELADMRDLGK